MFTRIFENCELRSIPNSDRREIVGIGAVYYDGTPGTEYKLGPNMVERILPGAFDEFLKSKADCVSLFDHEQSRLLGRRSSGSLTIEATPTGIAYRIPIDMADPDHQYTVSKIARGDVKGSSVIFNVLPGGEYYTREGSLIVRNLRSITIGDIGPTWKPCYTATTAELRSLQESAIRLLPIDPPLPIEFWRQR